MKLGVLKPPGEPRPARGDRPYLSSREREMLLESQVHSPTTLMGWPVWSPVSSLIVDRRFKETCRLTTLPMRGLQEIGFTVIRGPEGHLDSCANITEVPR